jgi:VRR-NUC domain
MPTEKIQLAADYYLHNFSFLINWVLQGYGDLLNTDEKEFIYQFQQLSHPAQCLLVRLSGRRGPYFRESKLKYSEIASIPTAAIELEDCGLLRINPSVSISELGNILTKAELMEIFCETLASIKQEKKEILLEFLQTTHPHTLPWLEWTDKKWGHVYFCDHQQTLNTLKLLFFGNSRQDLTEFVLQDLGLFRYESYLIDHQHRLFKHRDEIDEYWVINQLREELTEATELDHLIELSTRIPATASNAKQTRRLAKLTHQLAYQLEINSQFDLALDLYERHDQPPSRERRVRLLEKQGKFQQAWAELDLIRQCPANEHELQIVERMAPRLAKKAGNDYQKKLRPSFVETFIQLSKSDDEKGFALTVEQVALQQFNQNNQRCFYVENQLFTSLFGLWLWPEMFRGIDGAFANPFQTAPLDMYQDNFIENRQGLTTLWTLLDQDDYPQILMNCWQQKSGIANQWVYWELEEEILTTALAIIPVAHLKAIFRRLLFDTQNNRSGFPDLIVLDSQNKSYKLIEVKGPGDRLQDNQIRWLEYFQQHKIPAEVCYVDWA